MHPFSVLTLGIFVAGYITARWDLVTRLHELAIFAWDTGVLVCLRRGLNTSRTERLITPSQTRTIKGFAILSFCFFLFVVPIAYIASQEAVVVRKTLEIHTWCNNANGLGSTRGPKEAVYLRGNN